MAENGTGQIELAKLEAMRAAAEQAPPTEPKPRREPRPTKRALRDAALEELEPLAVERLRAQLDHPDPRVQQAAAKIILDHKWGRASQRTQDKHDTMPTKVVYETAAAPLPDDDE